MDRGWAVFRMYTVLGRTLAALPEPVALGVGYAVSDAAFLLGAVRRGGGHRDMVTRNLRRVLGPDVDDDVLRRWARRSFRSYGRYWVEGARLGRTTPAEVMAHVTPVEGLEHLRDGMQAGRGVVMALPHVGSWEYGGAYLSAIGYPMTAVAERIEPPELFDYFVQQRAAMGLTVVPLGPGSGGSILGTLRQGGLVGLLSDRDIGRTGIDVDFFGEKTTMPAGPATVALRTGAVLVTGAVYSGPGLDHRAVVEPPIDTTRTGSFRGDVARITQEIALRFEGLIRHAPEQWHVFQPLWPADRPEAGS